MIPNGTRFIGIAPEVDLTERGSALLNKRTEPYTIDDIRGYKVFTALLTQSGESDILTVYVGTDYGPNQLTIGITYTIEGNDTTDFTNVGAPNNEVGTSFIATGTNPNNQNANGQTYLDYNTGAPVVNVLENTIGNIWFSYQSEGIYIINSNDLFTQNKTILFASSMNNGNDTNNHTATIYVNAPSELTFASWGNTGDVQQDLYNNSIPLPIEIRVYN